ncbi:MAG: HvfC family peptide modification chaperone, partial [Chitinophagaceae bacterium]
PFPPFHQNGDWFKDQIVINPEFRMIRFNFPVHLMKPMDAKDHPGDYFLLVFRDQPTGQVQFVNLSVLFVFIIEQIQLGEQTLEQILKEASSLFRIRDQQTLNSQVLSFIQDLHSRDFILGFS